MSDKNNRDEELIYNMKLHEKIDVGNYIVCRVAGGWIYHYHRLDLGQMNSIFVPYHNEFQ